jgi:hypothetical protein
MILEKIKNKLWLVSIPVAIAALLSMSAIKDIEDAHVELELGKRTAYYLRTSTDSLTYLAIAYAAMNDTAFFTDQYLSYKTRIINSIENLKNVTYEKSNDKLQRAVLELNIYIYFLVLLLLGFVVLIRFDKQPIIKPVRKKKPIKKSIKKK